MITKVQGEAPFQVLTNNFSISPSNEGYTLQISADGKEYSDLFTVAANTTRLVSNVAANSYYRLKGNDSEVSVNWMRTCVTEGQGGGGETYTAGANINISDQNVISVSGLSTINGSAITAGGDIVIEGGGSTEGYWDSATTKTYVDSAITGVQDQLDVIDQVIPAAITDLNERVDEISGQSVDLSAFYTSAQTEEAISAATSGKADAANIAPWEWGYHLPKYNSQGIITGYTQAWMQKITLNGVQVSNLQAQNQAIDPFYAPTAAGTAGDILVSTGNGAPVWSAMPAADVTKAYVDSAVTEVSDHLFEVEEVTASAITYLNGLIAEISGTTPDLSAYWTSAQTKTYADSAATIAYNSAATHIDDIELVMSSALNEFHTQIQEISGNTPDLSAFWTSAVTDEHIVSAITPIQSAITVIDQVIPAAIVDINNRMVSSTSVHTIWQGLQSEYDALTNSGATADPATLYIIKSN